MRTIFGLILLTMYAFYLAFMIEKYPLYAASPYGAISLVLWWANVASVTAGSLWFTLFFLRPRG